MEKKTFNEALEELITRVVEERKAMMAEEE